MHKAEKLILKLYKQGWTIELLAEHFGYLPVGIEAILRRYTSACPRPNKDYLHAIALATVEEVSWEDSHEGKKAAKMLDRLKPFE